MKRVIAKVVSLILSAAAVCTAFAACGERREGTVDIAFYAVNDLHGKFMDTDAQPGVDEFTTYMKDLYRDDRAEEVLLSSGDMWQGTVESSSTKGELMTEWMKDAGFVSMTLGNHEFDWGTEAIAANQTLAGFPILGINVTYEGGPANFCTPSTVVERGGVKIGVIGAIGDCLSSISGEFQTGLHFETGSTLTSLVKAESKRLREKEGCDLIVYSLHDGGDSFSSSGVNTVTDSDMPYYDTELSDGYVDLVFEGHTHKQYILKDEYGVYHLQGGGENKAISYAKVSYNTATGDFSVKPEIIKSSTYAKSSIKDDPIVEQLFEKHFPDEDPYTTVLGKNSAEWDSSDLADKVSELYYKKGVDTWGAKYDIVLGGGYLKTRSPYDLAKGDVTYADVFSLLPFDNSIVLGSIRGSYLKSNFFGNKSNYHRYSPSLTASAIEDNATYYIIVDTYTSTYRANHITEVARISNFYARDLIAEYIKDGHRA